MTSNLLFSALARLAVLAFLATLPACSKQRESIVAIALHPTKSNIVFVATNEAVYKTRDSGVTWSRLPTISARCVTTLAIDPQFPATVYSGTMGDAVYKSPDGGQRWLPHNVGLKEHVSYINQFAFHPKDRQTIMAATTVGAFLTHNRGRTWEEQMAGMKEVHIVVTLAMHPRHPHILYAGTTGGVYNSTDGAASWRKVNNGLIPAEVLEASLSLGVNILVVDPVAPDTVYAGTTKGLFKTTNGAESWARIGEPLPDQFISSLVLDPTNPQVPYAAGGAGIHKSLDGGTQWQVMNKGLDTQDVRTIVMNPLDTRILYTGTNGSGLYRSTDGGESWTPVPLASAPSEKSAQAS